MAFYAPTPIPQDRENCLHPLPPPPTPTPILKGGNFLRPSPLSVWLKLQALVLILPQNCLPPPPPPPFSLAWLKHFPPHPLFFVMIKLDPPPYRFAPPTYPVINDRSLSLFLWRSTSPSSVSTNSNKVGKNTSANHLENHTPRHHLYNLALHRHCSPPRNLSIPRFFHIYFSLHMYGPRPLKSTGQHGHLFSYFLRDMGHWHFINSTGEREILTGCPHRS